MVAKRTWGREGFQEGVVVSGPMPICEETKMVHKKNGYGVKKLSGELTTSRYISVHNQKYQLR